MAYADDVDRWWGLHHDRPTPYPIWCRSNVGEVFPNVISLLGASLIMEGAKAGQARWSIETGMISKRQLAAHGASMIEPFGGYLYVNVSLGRIAAVRAPGLSPADIDTQLYGLTDAPPYVARRGDRSLLASLRMLRTLGGQLLRPDRHSVQSVRDDVERWRRGVADVAATDDAGLVALARTAGPWCATTMHALLVASGAAGVARSVLEQVVAAVAPDRPDAVNVLTGGLGTIESAEPARDLWALGRLVATSPVLTHAFDDGLTGLAARLGALDGDAEVATFRRAFDRFLDTHGARGPDEIELASPTWGTDPEIALAAIERLRHAPPDRDPVRAQTRLAEQRTQLCADLRSRLRPPRRWIFDRAMRACAAYAAEREATKASLVRSLEPARQALFELARRAGVSREDLFLLTIDELPAFLADQDAFAAVVDERRAQRRFLAERVPPFWFEGRIPPPATWARRADQRHPDGSTRVLTGLGVCPGAVTGRASIVTDPADPRDLGPDDILVAPLTDPAWTPLFLAVAGVVVDVGAQQSHAAIIARELGIPAVVSVAGASTTIPDGALVTVDGATGTVTVH